MCRGNYDCILAIQDESWFRQSRSLREVNDKESGVRNGFSLSQLNLGIKMRMSAVRFFLCFIVNSSLISNADVITPIVSHL